MHIRRSRQRETAIYATFTFAKLVSTTGTTPADLREQVSIAALARRGVDEHEAQVQT